MRNWLLFILLLGFLGYGIFDLIDLFQTLPPAQMNTLVLMPKLVQPLGIIGCSLYLLYKNFLREEPESH